MKKTNIVLGLLILVMALSGAIFSFLFFMKRGDFTGGWNHLSSAIHSGSAEMDKNSGTQTAAQLAPAKLHHDKYSELNGLLPKLSDQSRKVIAQRDELANALVGIAKAGNVKNFDNPAKLRNVNSVSAESEKLGRAVREVFESRDGVYRRVKSVGQSLGATVETNRLIKGDNSALDSFEERVGAMQDRRSNYENALSRIGRLVGVRFDRGNYAASGAEVVSALTRFQNDYENLKATMDREKQENRRLLAKVSSQQRELAARRRDMSDREFQLNGYQAALKNKDFVAVKTPMWQPGSAEARNALVGKVVEVNRDYGYIAIGIGTATRVNQKIEGKIVKIDPLVTSGMQCIVSNGELNDSPRYAATVKLAKVGAEKSTALIPADAGDIRVGDTVIVHATRTVAAN